MLQKCNVATPTSFDPDEALNTDNTLSIIEKLYEKGVRSILICGSTEKQHSLIIEEKPFLRQALKFACLPDDFATAF